MIEIAALSAAVADRIKVRLEALRTLFRTREEIYKDAYEGRQFNLLYFAMLVFACLIALLGLLLNSPAVIIGAMLISPLMGPILSCGLALTLADWNLARKAGKNTTFSVVETVLIAVLATSLSPLKDATPEILARTTPNLMDLLIAFFSGLAGTLALASRKGGLTILPGVAIATAVMPPLATVGYGLSTRQWNVAGGAFMLFFTNFTAIVISADLVYLLIGFRPQQVRGTDQHATLVKWRILIASVVLLALSVPLLRTLLRAAQQARVRRDVLTVLHQQFDRAGDRRLASMDIKTGQHPILIDSVVQTKNFIPPHEINSAEEAVSTKLRMPVRLIVEQLQLAHEIAAPPPRTAARANDFLAGGVVRSDGNAEYSESATEMLSRLQDRVKTVVLPLLIPAGVEELTVKGMGVEEGGKLRIELAGRQANLTEPQAWSVVSVALGKDLRAQVRIVADLELASAGNHDVQFRGNSIEASPVELRRVARFLSPWRQKAGIRLAFLVSQTARSELALKRVAALRRKLAVDDAGTVNLDASVVENTIRMKIVQSVDVDGGDTGVARAD